MRQLEADALLAQRALGPDEPLRDRRLGGEKRAGDLGDAEAADGFQAERDACVGWQRRMAAHEHHPQLIVFDRRVGGLHGRRPLQLVCDLVGSRRERGMAPEHVERAVSRDAEEPSAGILRHPGVGPLLQRLEERILDDFLRQFEMRGTEDAREPGDQLSRATAEQVVDQVVRGHGSHHHASGHFDVYIASTCRTSIVPP